MVDALGLLDQYFETAIAAPDGIKRLRELILSLAMRGKLVPQDPNDQPANMLLKEIEAEKNRLVKEGKIKKSKPLPEITPDEIPYDIPDSWKWVKAIEITDIGTGSTPTKSNSEYYGGNIPWYTSSATNYYIADKPNTFITEKALQETNCKIFPSGSLIIALYGQGKTRGQISEIKIAGATNQAIAAMVFFESSKETKKYLKYYFLKMYDEIRELAEGGAQPNLNVGKIKNSLIPLPPLEEQRRIVERIDRLMDQVDVLEKLRAERDNKRLIIQRAAGDRLLKSETEQELGEAWDFLKTHFNELYSVKENVSELRKAILQLAVMGKLVPQDPNDLSASELLKEIEAEKQRLIKAGKIKKQKPLPEITPEEIPYQIPDNWKWVKVTDVVDVGTGSTPATTNPEYYGGNIPWYTSSATNYYIADKPSTFITEKALQETNCKIFPSGSLIIALYGQGKTRGQISEIKIAGATNQAIAAMVFFESSKETKKYLKYYFLKMYDEIRELAEGGAQPNLNVGKIKNSLIPLPPLPEQHRIVAKVDQLMALCDQLEVKIEQRTSTQTDLLNALIHKI